jgi:predicted transcriptional regulator
MGEITTTSLKRDIRNRLKEIERQLLEFSELAVERERLEDALRALEATDTVTRAQSQKPRRTATFTGPRRARGDTKTRILAYLGEHGAATAGEIAGALDLKRNSVATRLAQLVNSGDLKKATRGYEIGKQEPKRAPQPEPSEPPASPTAA